MRAALALASYAGGGSLNYLEVEVDELIEWCDLLPKN